ncbi:hypothetical protein [Actinomadura rudentiformis]|uniref:hypothetical protein n=1 Tax=Actinomadura rudentiformis TaxID=359158 RepID=UPI00178C49C8|nr:hypothetical protein [Actinomadura rudentiformis]
MSIAGQIPPDWTISWIRTYDLGDLADIAPRDLLIAGSDGTGELLDVDAQAFFDIQTLRLGHVARYRLPPITFDGVLRLRAGERPVSGKVSVHLLVHASGFMVIRPTLRSEWLSTEGRVTAEVLGQLERAMWITGYPLRWHVSGGHVIEGSVRCVMNWVFFDLYERVHGVSNPEQVALWALEGIQGCDRLHEMYAEGFISYPFPVSFGAQFEIVNPQLSPLFGGMDTEAEWQRTIDCLMFPDRTDIRAVPITLGRETLDRWYLSENQALTLVPAGEPDAEMDVIDPDRTQLLEALGLRRAVLRCVQRDTQRVLTERRTVTRYQLERWQHMVASTTDDYVLHDRIGQLIEPIRLHNSNEILIRDLGDLERQVRANLAWFQERLDTLSAWTGGLVGASVGTVAMVLSLQEALKAMLSQTLGREPDKVFQDFGWLFALTMLTLMIISFAVAVTVIRRVTRTLSPFSRRLPIRGGPRARRRARALRRAIAAQAEQPTPPEPPVPPRRTPPPAPPVPPQAPPPLAEGEQPAEA